MDSSFYVEAICRERKITDYLDGKGIFPSREYNDKKIYKCPVHGDTQPSFTVYLNSEYENYYCFGCHSGTTIINLVSAMENISVKESFKKLIQGLNIAGADVLSKNSDKINSLISDGLYDSLSFIQNIEQIYLKINRLCYFYFKNNVNFDEKEVMFFEDIFQKIDILVRNKDKKSLEDIYDFLILEGIPKRYEYYLKNKEEREIQYNIEKNSWLN